MRRFCVHDSTFRWRPLAWAATALTAIALTAGFATAAVAQPPPGPAAGVAPGATAAGTTNYVFYTAADGSVWQKVVDSGSPATPVLGRLISAPSPITLADGTLQVFGEGTDHALWTTNCNPGGHCGAWTSLGGYLTSKPGAAIENGDTYRVYVRGGDGAVWANNHTTAGWSGWRSIGGRVLSGTGPSAAFRSVPFFVLVVGTNHELFIAEDGLTGFTGAGGVTNSSPALVNAPSSNSLVGFARGTTNAGYFHRFLMGTPGWHSMGGILTSGMGGTRMNSTWFAYALGTDTQVWQHTGTTDATGVWMRVTP